MDQGWRRNGDTSPKPVDRRRLSRSGRMVQWREEKREETCGDQADEVVPCSNVGLSIDTERLEEISAVLFCTRLVAESAECSGSVVCHRWISQPPRVSQIRDRAFTERQHRARQHACQEPEDGYHGDLITHKSRQLEDNVQHDCRDVHMVLADLGDSVDRAGNMSPMVRSKR